MAEIQWRVRNGFVEYDQKLIRPEEELQIYAKSDQ